MARKYQNFWNQLKEKGQITLDAPVNQHFNHIPTMMRKERLKDVRFQEYLSFNNLTSVMTYASLGTRLIITLTTK